MGTNEHGPTLWHRSGRGGQFAEVVNNVDGTPGRHPAKKMLMDNTQQGMGWCAIALNDQPLLSTPTYARVGTGNHVGAGFGTNDMYKYLNGTKLCVQDHGPDKMYYGFTTPTLDGPQTQGASGAKGNNTMVPPMTKKLR